MTLSLRSKRIVLRPYRYDDAGALAALMGNFEIVKWLAMPPWPYARINAEDFLARVVGRAEMPNSMARAITLDGTFIGGIGINPRTRGPTIGFWLGQPYWGRGLMSETAETMIAHYFTASEEPALYSGYLEGNTASARIHEKLGFVETSREATDSVPLKRQVPHVSLRLSREDWEKGARTRRDEDSGADGVVAENARLKPHDRAPIILLSKGSPARG